MHRRWCNGHPEGECSAGAVLGTQSQEANARLIQEDTQFHIASVRKSYIGFAVAFAVHHGMIAAIDDPIPAYLPEYKEPIYENITIRHLLTHTHGLQK